MNRRLFQRLAVATLGVVLATTAGVAQTPASPTKQARVGLLAQRHAVSTQTTTWRGELERVLALNGFDQGRNLILVEREAGGQVERLPALAREIAEERPDVIVAITNPAIRAAMTASPATPIVMVVGDDPVASGLISSLARPGGRLTGIVYQTPEGDTKRLQLLAEALPHQRRFGRLAPVHDLPGNDDRIARSAARLGIEVTKKTVQDAADYLPAFAAMKAEGAVGVLVTATQSLSTDVERIAAAAREVGLATICEWEYMARAGCALAYGHDLGYAQRRVAEYAAAILKGASPAELPAERSDAWQLTINLKVMRLLGLTVPPALLARADSTIE